MQLKASTDYGLRTVLYLAAQNRVCSSKEISEHAQIPRDYLIQLAQQERDAGLIESRSGKHGGYVIAKPPSDISLLEVLNAIEGNGGEAARARKEIREKAESDSGLSNVIDLVMDSYDAYLGSITLDMLIECSKNTDQADKYLAERLNEESERLTRGSEAQS